MEPIDLKKFYKKISHFGDLDQKEIKAAYLFALKKHSGQKRRSGEAYINHPLRVATALAENKYDKATIIAALLHDTIEDTNTTYGEIQSLYGDEIANIVNGVTKISSVKIGDKSKIFSDDELFINQVENYRKLLMAMVSDLRIILIKLHDRLDNILTVQYLPSHKIKFYARETIEIFAPIAERLGMGEIKGMLEDLSFPYAYPKEYEKFIKIAKKAYKNPKKTINKVIPVVEQALKESGIHYHLVSGRAKHHFSLFLKLKHKKDIAYVFDIVALRVIVESVEDCYKALGTIHSAYPPLPGRIFDYIARPKGSGYQSIHTTVKDDEGNTFEIQIRTREMHHHAEYGSAAHWHYKDQEKYSSKNLHKINQEWFEELNKIRDLSNGEDFIKVIKEEMFSKQVFVFTPKGEIINLPDGSTGVDLAYRIHTELGHRCKGIKINGRLMPLSTELETGDLIEIITGKKPNPSENWIKFAKTSGAKSKIRNFLRQKNSDQLIQKGEIMVQHFLEKNNLPAVDPVKADQMFQKSNFPINDLDSAYIAVAEGNLSKTKLAKFFYPTFNAQEKKLPLKTKERDKLSLLLKNIRHSFAGCCKPKPNDDVRGYLTRDHLIKIHKADCGRIANADPRRLFELSQLD